MSKLLWSDSPESQLGAESAVEMVLETESDVVVVIDVKEVTIGLSPAELVVDDVGVSSNELDEVVVVSVVAEDVVATTGMLSADEVDISVELDSISIVVEAGVVMNGVVVVIKSLVDRVVLMMSSMVEVVDVDVVLESDVEELELELIQSSQMLAPG